MVKTQSKLDSTAMLKNNAFCSICTINYSSYAATLNDSLRKVGHKEPHYVLIVDYNNKYEKIISQFKFTPIHLDQLKVKNINELIKRYNAFELSNVLKPFFLEWLLKNHPEIGYLFYLDTDIYIYSKLTDIENYLDKNRNISIAITPHISNKNKINNPMDYSQQRLYLLAGLYNGGFYALKNDSNSIEFLNWQINSLTKFGYNAPKSQMFVDQKILDFSPLIFSFVGIFKNSAYNVGHWNYESDNFEFKNNHYLVNGKPLTFFHFSNLIIDNVKNSNSNFFHIPITNNALFKIGKEYFNNLKHNHHKKVSKILYQFITKYSKPKLSVIDPITYTSNKLKKKSIKFNEKLEEINNKYNILVKERDDLRSRLDQTYNSKAWKYIQLYYRLRDIILLRKNKS